MQHIAGPTSESLCVQVLQVGAPLSSRPKGWIEQTHEAEEVLVPLVPHHAQQEGVVVFVVYRLYDHSA